MPKRSSSRAHTLAPMKSDELDRLRVHFKNPHRRCESRIEGKFLRLK